MQERTLLLIKPDAMKRKLAGEIIKRYEAEDLQITALKMVLPTREIAEKHYTDSEQQIVGMGNKTLTATGAERAKELFGTDDATELGKKLREFLVVFLTSGPLIAMVLEGEDVIQRVRKIAGFTNPPKADKGTIRGDMGIDSIEQANEEGRATENLVHTSGSPEEAEYEISVWFREDEILKI